MMARLLIAALLTLILQGSGMARSTLSPEQLAALEFQQHPGAALPRELTFQDEAGRAVRLDDFLGGGPLLLVLEYMRCTTLCGVVLGNLAQSLDRVPLDAGRDYQVVAVSIDPRETPADARAAKERYLARYHHVGAEAGWHFLTGSAAAIERLAQAVGFPYAYDPDIDQYAHPAGITVASGDGRIARYILGIDYRPLDLRLALTEASAERVASPATGLLLLCYAYDPQTGRYSLLIRNALRAACAVTVLGIAGMVVALVRGGRAG
jgi:protein SCO1/2